MLKRTKLLSLLTSLLFSATAMAEAGNMMVRMRAINIMPQEDGTTSANGDVRLQSESVPEIDFTYFLTDSVAFELIAATATHSAGVYNSAAGNVDLGEVSLLPPTLLVQYHHDFGDFKPYVGVGINYTFFYGEYSGNSSSILGTDYENSFGWAAQVGADYKIGEKVYLNVDVKRIALSTDVTVRSTISGAETITSDLDINPVVVGLGVGYRF